MIIGDLTKQEYKLLKVKYTADETRHKNAIADLEKEKENLLSGKSERLKWAECFKRFETLTELDRKVIASLIQSIRIIEKTNLTITFNYQFEYEKATAALSGVSHNAETGVA